MSVSALFDAREFETAARQLHRWFRYSTLKRREAIPPIASRTIAERMSPELPFFFLSCPDAKWPHRACFDHVFTKESAVTRWRLVLSALNHLEGD
jgi:hypothetical protein